ncbi:MAG: hypothetical protein ACXVEF_25570 [Polyangiales bacterium]
MTGTPVLASVRYVIEKYGMPAGHEVVRRMSPRWRPLLDPHSNTLGILGAKWYPYPFVGEIVKNAIAAVHAADEDAFIRELAVAGIDASVGTVARVLLRYAATPGSLAARGQEAWNMFHDTGRVSIVVSEHSYVVTVNDWTHHDVNVCKITKEVRRRLLERSGLTNVEAHRDRCIDWGHEACVVRLEW